jgi:hypothetical protein
LLDSSSSPIPTLERISGLEKNFAGAAERIAKEVFLTKIQAGS